MSDRSENSAIKLAMVDLVISATIPEHPNSANIEKKVMTDDYYYTPQVATS